MIRPLWNVNKGTDSSTSLGWSLTNVGKSYSSLFPNDLHFTKSYILQEAIVNTFQTGMAMIILHICLHLDQKDKNKVSHCSFSPPSTWKDDAVLGLKNVCFLQDVSS